MTKTIQTLFKYKQRREPIVALTAYDFSIARLVDQANVDILLVGDSLGMVVQGHPNTLRVRMEEMIYHACCVRRAVERALLLVDMPFGSYEASPTHALANAQRLVAEGGAQMIKLEGASPHQQETIHFLSERNVPVCAHIGLSPQSINTLGSFKVSGFDESMCATLIAEANSLQEAGASLLLLEAVPSDLAARITQKLRIPTIGIGSGIHTDGQILVVYDVLGISPRAPWFSKNFLSQGGSVQGALEAYATEVRERQFPAAQHCAEYRTGGGT